MSMDLEPLYGLIRHYEGLRLRVYLCPAGIPTQGYGHTGPKITLKSPPITEETAELWLREDAAAFVNAAIRYSPVLGLPWHNNKLCAIASFCYNLGSARYKASTLRRCVDAGDWEEAAQQFHKWVYAGGRKLPGLVARRKSEAALFLQ